MAMRRPRIKPVANIQLNSKRKAKTANDKNNVNGLKEVERQDNFLTNEHNVAHENTVHESNSTENALEVGEVATVDTTAKENNLNISAQKNEDNGKRHELSKTTQEFSTNNIENDKSTTKENEIGNKKGDRLEKSFDVVKDNAFKCPRKVGFQRAISHNSNSGVDDVFYSDIEENALQMDLEKTPTVSPLKNLIRQRIRPTPHFGQRRNSFLGSSPSPHTSASEDNNISSSNVNIDFVQPSIQTKRERHHSSSFIGNSNSSPSNHTTHKYLPTGITNNSMGRIRTESGCSVFSDTNTSSYKSRKMEDTKQNARRDFEARFQSGVPEKSSIKMYDLIYYNPVTNPMEQKTNPSVKEESESSANDVKPYSEKVEKETDTSADVEAVPVPQLKLNAKGELILDDKSLVIETTAEQEARKVLANSSLIYLDENTGMNGFYSRQKRTREWLPSETIKFYRCLQNVGTDFSLMVSLFPNRTRRDLKLKFKKEERKNCHLINKALLYPKQFDLESLKEQIGEDDKLRETHKKTNISKEKREKKKRKICTSSVSNRILLNEDIYSNENDQRSKKRINCKLIDDQCEDLAENNLKAGDKNDQMVEGCKDADNSQDGSHTGTEETPKQKKACEISKNVTKEITEDQVTKGIYKNEDSKASKTLKVNKLKRRRKRTPNKIHRGKIIFYKEEIIKIENKQESHQIAGATSKYQDSKQLQTEIDVLQDSDAEDLQHGNNLTYETSTANIFPIATTQEVEYNEDANKDPYPISDTTHQDNYSEEDMDINKYEHKTFVNLDDGSVNVYSKIEDDISYITLPAMSISLPSTPTRSQTPQLPPTYPITNENESLVSYTTNAAVQQPDTINNNTYSSVIPEHELNEEDIQSILTEIAEGSLVLVSTLDPDDSDKVLNEIYMIDKSTGDLCEEPLSIPDSIVQCILTVVNGAQI